MRTYEETHEWITFKLDLRRATYKFWMMMGEAQSKSDHVAGVPLLPVIAQYLRSVFLSKGAQATTAIEGNTLSEEDVRKRLEGKLDLPPSKAYLGQEIDNILEAYDRISDQVQEGKPTKLSVKDIKEYNRLVLKNLPHEQGVIPGEIRRYEVGVGRYRGAPSHDCAYLLQRLCDWLNSDFTPEPGQEVAFGILKAIIAHIYIAWIHPFGDGNGRTARLIEFQILLASGVPDTAAHLLSNYYNETRSEYYRQLDIANKNDTGIFSFIEYALQGFVDGLKEQIHLIQGQQIRVHWVNYVHDRFRNKDSPPEIRRRRLVLDLSEKIDIVPVKEVRHVSPRIAEAYAGKTDKTVQRDLNLLQDMGLIERTQKGVRAKPEIMRAFLPFKRHS